MPKLKDIKLKVCGLRDNIDEVVALEPDFAGFIFYEKSPRFVGTLTREQFNQVPEAVAKVGVFVNQCVDQVLQTAKSYGLKYVQLHGDESVNECLHLKANGVGVIKVFAGNHDINREELMQYAEVVDYYLFDTRLQKHGGNGVSFDWTRLSGINLPKPLILSGGIKLEDVKRLESLDDIDVYAIDVNSQFEISPGLKDTELIKQLKKQMQQSCQNQ